MSIRSLVQCAVASALTICAGVPLSAQKLIGFASLPADTYAPGPTSGQLIAPTDHHHP